MIQLVGGLQKTNKKKWALYPQIILDELKYNIFQLAYQCFQQGERTASPTLKINKPAAWKPELLGKSKSSHQSIMEALGLDEEEIAQEEQEEDADDSISQKLQGT